MMTAWTSEKIETPAEIRTQTKWSDEVRTRKWRSDRVRVESDTVGNDAETDGWQMRMVQCLASDGGLENINRVNGEEENEQSLHFVNIFKKKFFLNKSKWEYITKPPMITPHKVCKKVSSKKYVQS
jgi:hypothetical protein